MTTQPQQQEVVLIPDKPTFTVQEAARLLGISRGLAYQAVSEGTVPSIRIGRRILIPRARLCELLDEERHRDD